MIPTPAPAPASTCQHAVSISEGTMPQQTGGDGSSTGASARRSGACSLWRREVALSIWSGVNSIGLQRRHRPWPQTL